MIRAELADTPAKLYIGLMHRHSVPRGTGMLFVHPDEGIQRYWMRNVRVPLDLVWMDASQRIVKIDSHLQPCASVRCPHYICRAQFVLEVAAGEAQRLGLHVGQLVEFYPPDCAEEEAAA